MGMAASQARLLAITARIHDVEYQAQSIENAKVQLSTQSDQVYNEYLEALDAQILTVSTIGTDGSKSSVAATFNNLFSVNRVTPSDGSKYLLRNEKGKLIVEDAVYNAYEEFKDQDPYLFAISMLGGDTTEAALTQEVLQAYEESVYQSEVVDANSNKDLQEKRKSLEKYVKDGSSIYSGNLKEEYNNEEGKETYEALLKDYREALYKSYGKEICTNNINTTSQGIQGSGALMTNAQFDDSRFQNYIDIFNQIKLCGGCVPISDYNGSFGDASNNTDWLTSMISCGKFTIDVYSKDKNGKETLTTTSPSSDTSLSYKEETSIDNTALKKAEAKYEKDLKDIDKKDKQYDLTLSKLETERNALTTEYDSVKKVIEDNIDRTFGIFS